VDAPEDLTRGPLPEDLQLLLHELKVPTSDPLLPLLGWLWTQVNQTTNTIADARMSFIAALDTRLEKITTSADLLVGVNQQMELTRKSVATISSETAERIGSELKAPIEQSLSSCRTLAQLLDRLLRDTTQLLERTHRKQLRAVLVAGFLTGVLTGLCLSSLGFLHH